MNVRLEDKLLFDLLHVWWSRRERHGMSQWDAFSVLLALAAEHPDADLPPGVRRPSRRG